MAELGYRAFPRFLCHPISLMFPRITQLCGHTYSRGNAVGSAVISQGIWHRLPIESVLLCGTLLSLQSSQKNWAIINTAQSFIRSLRWLPLATPSRLVGLHIPSLLQAAPWFVDCVVLLTFLYHQAELIFGGQTFSSFVFESPSITFRRLYFVSCFTTLTLKGYKAGIIRSASSAVSHS